MPQTEKKYTTLLKNMLQNNKILWDVIEQNSELQKLKTEVLDSKTTMKMKTLISE